MKKNEILTKESILIFLFIAIMFILGWNYAMPDKPSVTHVEEEVIEETPVITEDIEANCIYLTKQDTPVFTNPDENSQVIGYLQSNVSITVTGASNNEWGKVKEFEGWVYKKDLAHVNINDVIGHLFTKTSISPVYYSKPDTSSEITKLKGMNVYEILPVIYNYDFYRIGHNAYIPREFVIVDYYEKNYFDKNVRIPTTSTTAERHRVQIERTISLELTQPSGLTIEELEQLTFGTELHGIAPYLKEIEETNGVNAIFALSVAQLESGYGTSGLARSKNNIFGLAANSGGMSFSTKGECVRYFGNLIEKHYFGKDLTDLYSLGEVYCETTSWPSAVNELMYKNMNSVNIQ